MKNVKAIAVRIQGLDYRSWSIQGTHCNLVTEAGTYGEALHEFVSLCRNHFGIGSISIEQVHLQNWTPYSSEKIDMDALRKEHNKVIDEIMDEFNNEVELRNENAGVHAFEYDQEEMDRIARNTVYGYE